MGKVVIPVDFLIIQIHLVAVGRDAFGIEIDFLSHAKAAATTKEHFAFGSSRVGAVRPNDNRRSLNSRPIHLLGHETTVTGKRLERTLAHYQYAGCTRKVLTSS